MARPPNDDARCEAALAELDPKLRARLAPILRCESGVWRLVACNVAKLNLEDIGKLLAAKLPIAVTHLRLTNAKWKGVGLAKLLASPGCATIEELNLYGCEKLVDGLDAFATHAANLRALRHLGIAAIKPRASQLEPLRDKALGFVELDLSRNNLRDDDGIDFACKTPAFARLRSLACGGNTAGGKWPKALAKSKFLRDLEHLDLAVFISYDTAFGPSHEDWATFAATDNFPKLRTLNLAGHTKFDNAAARALADNPAFATLERLDLSGTYVDLDGYAALAKSKHVKPARIVARYFKPLTGIEALFPKGVVELAD